MLVFAFVPVAMIFTVALVGIIADLRKNLRKEVFNNDR